MKVTKVDATHTGYRAVWDMLKSMVKHKKQKPLDYVYYIPKEHILSVYEYYDKMINAHVDTRTEAYEFWTYMDLVLRGLRPKYTKFNAENPLAPFLLIGGVDVASIESSVFTATLTKWKAGGGEVWQLTKVQETQAGCTSCSCAQSSASTEAGCTSCSCAQSSASTEASCTDKHKMFVTITPAAKNCSGNPDAPEEASTVVELDMEEMGMEPHGPWLEVSDAVESSFEKQLGDVFDDKMKYEDVNVSVTCCVKEE